MTKDEIESRIKSAINDVKRKSIKVLAVEADRSIQKNFDAGGRPKWEPRKRISKKQRGRNILVISGRMRQISATTEEDRVVLKSNPLARNYSAIQHMGGVIDMPARKIRIRKNKDGRGRFAKSTNKRAKEVSTKPYRITIPARPWMTVPEADFPKILQSIKTAINL